VTPDRRDVFRIEASNEESKTTLHPFAMAPEELIIGHLDDFCFRLFCYLDLKQGLYGMPCRGLQYVADKLGVQERTVSIHAGHLHDQGRIRMTPDPREWSPGTPMGQVELRVLHNPSRKRFNPQAKKLKARPARYRKSSVMSAAAKAKRNTQEILPHTETWTAPREPRDTVEHPVPRPAHLGNASDAGWLETDSTSPQDEPVPRDTQDAGFDSDGYVDDLSEDDPGLEMLPDSDSYLITDEDIARWDAEDEEGLVA
jgi:hypothetical protein